MVIKNNRKKVIREKSSSGFTLVELLVSVTILAIITGMSLPLIRNTIADNKQNKYETYEKTIVESAKLYTGSYAEDMFGLKKVGCKIVKYSELAAKGLVKDININNETCGSDDTIVKINKVNDEYTYEYFIRCTNKETGQEVYKSDNVVSACDSEITTPGPKITLNPKDEASTAAAFKYKDRVIDININSSFGITGDGSIYYGWSTSNTEESVTDWKKVTVSNAGVPKDAWSKVVKASTNDLADGIYYLHVRTVDEYGNSSIKDAAGIGSVDRDVVGGPYTIDRTGPTKPVITNPTGGSCVTYSFSLTGNSSDAVSGIKYWQYKYASIDWQTYGSSAKNTFVTTPFSAIRNEPVYIRACDYAGNCSEVATTNICIKPKPPTYPNTGGACTLVGNTVRTYAFAPKTWRTIDGEELTVYWQIYKSDGSSLTPCYLNGWGYKHCPYHGVLPGYQVVNDSHMASVQ